jgi:competence protein ComGC
VELLVVIVIIIVMLSLLLPSLGRARESAKVASCANNLGQVAKALVAYCNENDDRFPQISSLAAGGDIWDAKILPYMDNDYRAFRCPSDNLGGKSGNLYPRSYAANGGVNYSSGMGRYPFGGFGSPPASIQSLRVGDIDAAQGDIILLSERPGVTDKPTRTYSTPRSYVTDFSFCSQDEIPSFMHKSAEGGNYLMASFAVRYRILEEIDRTVTSTNYWFVEY